jgi:aryl-alcohol dehydrogenase-like predicted oxidoreductase
VKRSSDWQEEQMQYREHLGDRLSEIGIGCYALSGVYGTKDAGQFIGLLRRAYELGVTFFDTADVYGPAEEILGRAVAPFRSRVRLATKVGARADGRLDCSAEHVVASCESSLRRLQTDYLDLYQIHFDDPGTPVEETVEALEKLEAAGKIRHYGVGHLPLPRMRAYFATGNVFSALVELSGAARGARDHILPLCRDRGVGVIAFSTAGRGLLTGKIGAGHVFEEGDIRRLDPLFQREKFASGLRTAEKFRALGEKHGKTPVQVAIAWVLAQPGIVCALTGPSTVSHLEENLGASGWDIAPGDLAELEYFFRDEDEQVRQAQTQAVCAILAGELRAESALTDLVYALETLVEIEVAAEAEIRSLFQRLWGLRGRQDAATLEQMRALQTELRERFSLQLASGGAR